MRFASWPSKVDEDAFMMAGDSTGRIWDEGCGKCEGLSWVLGGGSGIFASELGDMAEDIKGDAISFCHPFLGECIVELAEALREWVGDCELRLAGIRRNMVFLTTGDRTSLSIGASVVSLVGTEVVKACSDTGCTTAAPLRVCSKDAGKASAAGAAGCEVSWSSPRNTSFGGGNKGIGLVVPLDGLEMGGGDWFGRASPFELDKLREWRFGWRQRQVK